MKFCTGCGARFPDAEPTAGQGYGAQGGAGLGYGAGAAAGRRAPGQPVPVPVSRLRSTPVIAAASVLIVMLAAGAVGFWLYGRHSPHPAPGRNDHALTGATQTAPASTPASSTPGPSPLQSEGGPGVTIASNAAQDSRAQAVAAFLNQYFSAINAHDYQAYTSLLSPSEQQNFTEAQFQSGYGSTTDSDETLVNVSTAADGDTSASVTFTSNQNSPQSVNQADTCTGWAISLFLGQGTGSYLIDPPPSGYHASHSSCS
jgi:hypothetical protein